MIHLNMFSWLRDPTFWTACFTFVIAVATVFYVIFTQKLWKETKTAADAASASADAAKSTADAAKRDVDIQIALHRPYMGISRFSLTDGVNSGTWNFACEMKNYGLFPAERTFANIKVILAGDLQRDINEPSQVEIFPGQTISVLANFVGSPQDRQAIFDGSKELCVRVRIGYMAAGKKRFEYSAQVQFIPRIRDFLVVESHTQELPY